MLAREGLSGPADEMYEASVVGLLWTSQLWISFAGKCHRRGGALCGKKGYNVDETRRDEGGGVSGGVGVVPIQTYPPELSEEEKMLP